MYIYLQMYINNVSINCAATHFKATIQRQQSRAEQRFRAAFTTSVGTSDRFQNCLFQYKGSPYIELSFSLDVEPPPSRLSPIPPDRI